jgi:hypothetical protein
MIAGCEVGEQAEQVMAQLLLEAMIALAEGAWQEFQEIPDWRPGTVGGLVNEHHGSSIGA